MKIGFLSEKGTEHNLIGREIDMKKNFKKYLVRIWIFIQIIFFIPINLYRMVKFIIKRNWIEVKNTALDILLFPRNFFLFSFLISHLYIEIWIGKWENRKKN